MLQLYIFKALYLLNIEPHEPYKSKKLYMLNNLPGMAADGKSSGK